MLRVLGPIPQGVLVCLVVALVLFVVAAVSAVAVRSWHAFLACLGLGFLVLGLLVR